jgi:hypothetical protein
MMRDDVFSPEAIAYSEIILAKSAFVEARSIGSHYDAKLAIRGLRAARMAYAFLRSLEPFYWGA